MAAEADTFSVNHAAEARFYTRRDDLQEQYEKGNLSREEYQARICSERGVRMVPSA